MATELQRRKFEKAFDRFDTDGDGVLDLTDITSLTQIWCDEFNIAPRSDEWRKIHQLGHTLWQDILGEVDTDSSGNVTRAEWAVAMDRPDFVDRVALPFALAVFDIADKDSDGALNFAEFHAGQNHAGISEAEARAVFDKLDTDHDGSISRAAFSDAVKDFYLSSDPNAPGHLLVGDV